MLHRTGGGKITAIECEYLPGRVIIYFPSLDSCKNSEKLIDLLSNVIQVDETKD